MLSFQKDDMGLFTFYMQQIEEEERRKSKTLGKQNKPTRKTTQNNKSDLTLTIDGNFQKNRNG